MWNLQVRNMREIGKLCPNVFSQIFRTSRPWKLNQRQNYIVRTNIVGPEKYGLSQNSNRIQLLPQQDMRAFMKEYPKVVQDLITCPGFECMVETNNWVKEVADYNVPHGKLLRPTLMLATAKLTQQKTGVALPNLTRIAWAYEFLQGFVTILDDIVDGSTTRRDRPCWYLVGNLGGAAINDGILLESSAYVLLRKYVKGHYSINVYTDLVDTLHECTLKGFYGQSLDGKISAEKQYDRFTMEMYKNMMKFKNGYYTFYVPIVMALLLNQVVDGDIFRKIERTSLDLGLIYSVQDDFIDCFVDPAKSGKVGTDIQDGKPTWLIIQALSKANQKQRQALLHNYGQKDDPQKWKLVKEIYEELGIPEMYSNYERNEIDNICEQIEQLPEIVPKEPLQQLLSALTGRIR